MVKIKRYFQNELSLEPECFEDILMRRGGKEL